MSCSTDKKSNMVYVPFKLVLNDPSGFPFSNILFDFVLKISKLGEDAIKLSWSQLNFYTSSATSPQDTSILPYYSGGFLSTFSGQLPKKYRPQQNTAYVVGNGDGTLSAFSNTNNPVSSTIFNATIAGNILTVPSTLPPTSFGTALAGNIAIGQTVLGTGILPNTIITAFGSGTGGAGTYTLSQTQTVTGPLTVTTGPWPLPSPGYLLWITTSGQIYITANGENGNVIPTGPHTLLPSSQLYEPRFLCKWKCSKPQNVILDQGPINITLFSTPLLLDLGVRDLHVNDTLGNVVAQCWTSNSSQSNQTLGVMDLLINIGTLVPHKKCGFKIKPGTNVNLTNFSSVPNSFTGYITGNILTVIAVISGVVQIGQLLTATGVLANTIVVANTGVNTYTVNNVQTLGSASNPVTFSTSATQFAFDTAIAINPVNPLNIICSFLVSDSVGDGWPLSRSSFDGGHTFGPTIVVDPAAYFAENVRGVIFDQFGTAWYSINDGSNIPGINYKRNNRFYYSTDGGATWNTQPSLSTYPSANSTNRFAYANPSICVGGSGSSYGIYWASSISNSLFDMGLAIGFIPITGFGTFGPMQYFSVNNTSNMAFHTSIAVNRAGSIYVANYDYADSHVGSAKLWVLPAGQPFLASSVLPARTISTLAPSWVTTVNSYLDTTHTYWPISVQGIQYDEDRQALYVTLCLRYSLFSQDYELFTVLSLDDGVTWSPHIPVSKTTKNNRGYFSMKYSSFAKSLIYGFYDARNDPNSVKLQYIAALVNSKTLDRAVEELKQI